MKVKKEGEELIKVGYRLPRDIIRRIEQSAIANRRSVNDEVIVLLEAALSGDGGPISAEGLYRLLRLKFDQPETRPPEEREK